MPRQSLAEKAKRKGHTAAAMTATRTNAIEQMNSQLRRKFAQIEKSVNDLRAENLRYYHSIGQTCEAIRQKPEAYVGKDGTPGLKLIEQALSTQSRTLRKAAMFAREYTEEQLEQLIGLVNTNTKFQLNWGHVSFLLTLPTPEKRDRFAQEAVEKMLDPPALHELIKKRTQRSKGHGRTHAMPKGVAAQLRQIISVSKQWSAKNTDVWNGTEESVFGNVLNMPPDDMEPDMVEQLVEIENLMQEITEAAETNIATARRVREHLAGAIEKRDNSRAQAAESNGRPARDIDLTGEPAPTRRRRTAPAA